MEKRWEFAGDVDSHSVDQLAQKLGVHPVIAQILIRRNITEADAAHAFFNPRQDALHDPMLLDGMEEAAKRIVQALWDKEKICIYGDYDVDGITSVSLLYLFFREIGGDVCYHIPNRQEEGYGISQMGIDQARAMGASLIVTVDCGITSITEVEYARSIGLDMIITDHHQAGEGIPNAVAVVNPKLPGSRYPFNELAGVGVAYKLAQGVSMELGLASDYLDPYQDLVAVGTAADIVPLVDENRTFVRFGLERINNEPHVGIRALIETANLRFGKIDVGQIIYGLAPRINAVGRLGSAERAVELMITANSQRALHLASELEDENRTRKMIDTHTLEEAVAQVEDMFDPSSDRVIVAAQNDWHSGVIGIVASRLIERYYRPTVMISVEDCIGKGSARSIPGFDLYDALRECSDLLTQFGGHTYAAGLTIDETKIPEFRRRFNEVASERLSKDDLIPKQKIDAALELSDITASLYDQLKQFAPFGPHNPRPVFVSYNVALAGYPRIVGNNHLKFQLRRNGSTIDCIGFNLGEKINRIDPIRPKNHIVYTIEENEWNGRVSIQLRLKDVKNGQIPELDGHS